MSFFSIITRKILNKGRERLRKRKIRNYLNNGRVPWSDGYLEYKADVIKGTLINSPLNIKNLGIGLDERIVELPWVINNLSTERRNLLDAGSSLNHDYILDLPLIKAKDLTICTYYPENYSRVSQRISYVFSDLRELPFKDEWFNEIVCVSTLEHIDMDNSIYGYKSNREANMQSKSYSYLKVINELQRVLMKGGSLLITFPFGKFENHGFFQQFDEEMLNKLIDSLKNDGESQITFFKYFQTGWCESEMKECKDEESFNPHTGKGKKNDGAAHCRAIACVYFIKNK